MIEQQYEKVIQTLSLDIFIVSSMRYVQIKWNRWFTFLIFLDFSMAVFGATQKSVILVISNLFLAALLQLHKHYIIEKEIEIHNIALSFLYSVVRSVNRSKNVSA